MKLYTFQRPLLNDSTKEISIFDEHGVLVGHVSRYFESKGSYLANWITSIVNVKARDLQSKVTIDIVDQGFWKTLLRAKWNISYTNQKSIQTELIDKSKIKTNRRMHYTIEGRNVIVSKDIGDRVIRFKSSEGTLLAEGTFDKLIPPSTETIKIYDDHIHFCEIVAIYFLFQLQV
ncbi:tubby C-terminal domain-like protein [Bacillus nitroreducens]